MAVLARGRDIRMKAKRNRYYLGLWELGKRQLYGRAGDTVQIPATQSLCFYWDQGIGFANSTSTKTE